MRACRARALPLGDTSICDGVTEGNRTLTCWDTTNRDYHYTTATMSAFGEIRTPTVQALILAPPAVGLRTLALRWYPLNESNIPNGLRRPMPGLHRRGQDGAAQEIRTPTVLLLRQSPPAIGLERHVGA